MRTSLRTKLSQFPLWSVAAVLYVLALMLPAAEIGGSDLFGRGARPQTMPGIWCFGMGMLAPTPAYANIALAFGAVFASYQKQFAAVVFALLAVLIAASTLLFIDARPGLFALRGLHVGFWFWLASCVIMLWARFRELSPPLVLPDDAANLPSEAPVDSSTTDVAS
jgi:hypothetical protein